MDGIASGNDELGVLLRADAAAAARDHTIKLVATGFFEEEDEEEEENDDCCPPPQAHHEVRKLIEHNAAWAQQVSRDRPGFFQHLSVAQEPPFFFISCSDSRIAPATALNLCPGNLFVLRNIANQMQPYDVAAQAALEYAVNCLRVRHIIVCGHTNCGGVKAALLRGARHKMSPCLKTWLHDIVALATEHADSLAADERKEATLCEMNAKQQLSHVAATIPVRQAWADGRSLQLHAWLYELATGRVKELVVVDGPHQEISIL